MAHEPRSQLSSAGAKYPSKRGDGRRSERVFSDPTERKPPAHRRNGAAPGSLRWSPFCEKRSLRPIGMRVGCIRLVEARHASGDLRPRREIQKRRYGTGRTISHARSITSNSRTRNCTVERIYHQRAREQRQRASWEKRRRFVSGVARTKPPGTSFSRSACRTQCAASMLFRRPQAANRVVASGARSVASRPTHRPRVHPPAQTGRLTRGREAAPPHRLR